VSPDAPPVIGRAAIPSGAESFFPRWTIQNRTTPEEMVVAGDLAAVHATYLDVVTPKGEGEPEKMSGVWLILLSKQSDGSWGCGAT